MLVRKKKRIIDSRHIALQTKHGKNNPIMMIRRGNFKSHRHGNHGQHILSNVLQTVETCFQDPLIKETGSISMTTMQEEVADILNQDKMSVLLISTAKLQVKS